LTFQILEKQQSFPPDHMKEPLLNKPLNKEQWVSFFCWFSSYFYLPHLSSILL